MATKITWAEIYYDFEKRHPKLSKTIEQWRPYDFATVMMYTKDGYCMTYNYDTKQARFIKNVTDE